MCAPTNITHMEAATTKSGILYSTHALITPWDTDMIMLYGGYVGMHPAYPSIDVCCACSTHVTLTQTTSCRKLVRVHRLLDTIKKK